MRWPWRRREPSEQAQEALSVAKEIRERAEEQNAKACRLGERMEQLHLRNGFGDAIEQAWRGVP